jgi:hypothetical protein
MRALLLVLAGAMSLHATTYYVTIAGLGGEPDYEQRFSGWAKDLDKALRSSPEAKIETLYGPAATKAKFQSVMGQVARDAKPDDALVVTLIGHGSFDGSDYKINLPGPDLTAAELTELVDRVAAKRQLVVNMTSCSGASRPALERANRVVVTATRSAAERNATIFPRYWVEALRSDAADTDKDDVISALEAFRYAQAKTATFYESQKRLATEHAMLNETEQGGGVIAGHFPLLKTGAAQDAATDPAAKALLAHKEDLEQQIDKLKYDKATLPAEEYKKRMADLLLELAKTQARLDK